MQVDQVGEFVLIQIDDLVWCPGVENQSIATNQFIFLHDQLRPCEHVQVQH